MVKEKTGWWGSSKYGEGQTEAGGEFGEWRWREREKVEDVEGTKDKDQEEKEDTSRKSLITIIRNEHTMMKGEQVGVLIAEP